MLVYHLATILWSTVRAKLFFCGECRKSRAAQFIQCARSYSSQDPLRVTGMYKGDRGH
jgi:hypothetical protein